MIRVLFFGSLQDVAGTAELSLPSCTSPAELVAALAETRPRLAEALRQPQVMVAIDQTLGGMDSPLNDDSEVAFMPPVTGG